MASDWVALATFPFHLVHLVSGALQAAGMPLEVDPPTVSTYGLEVGSFGHRIMVPPERLDEARQILAEINDQPPQSDQDMDWDTPPTSS